MYKATIKNQIFIVRLAKIHLWIVLILFFTFSLPFLLSSLDLNFSTKFYQLGIAENKVLFQQSSQDKLNFIQKLQSKGRLVLMLGDGWNDAPALTQADLSLTLTSGTDATLEAADIILLTPDLNRLLLLFKISQSTLKLVRQNIIISLVYNFIAIPLAIFGLVIPLVAALSMSLSSLLVVGNSFLHFQSLQDK